MIGQFVKGKVYIFIDGANVFYTQKALGFKISYLKLMEYFKKECGEDVKCFFYIAYNYRNRNEKKFLDMLDINGYIVKTKSIKKINIGSNRDKYKGNLDIELAFDMVKLSNKYDTAILMSGDSDFYLPIDYIKQEGKWVIVISSRGRVAKELLERAKFIDLRKIKNKIAQ